MLQLRDFIHKNIFLLVIKVYCFDAITKSVCFSFRVQESLDGRYKDSDRRRLADFSSYSKMGDQDLGRIILRIKMDF